MQLHELVNDVFSNLRAAAEANTLLGNNYTIDVNSMTLADRKTLITDDVNVIRYNMRPE